ncbi:hypothetical protein pipiens_005790 [Culex pipiens pipiens]|uniref:PiggyBac transposable element-derived protein domain-containing protein n=1 Tax=Culex pipiens pipiens TaxID=38569 RepID=A0ABD1DXX4_CULPP
MLDHPSKCGNRFRFWPPSEPVPRVAVLQSTQQDDPREIGSCIQLFHGELMITSYLPNKKKHVLMLSTDPDVLPLKLHGQEEKLEEAGESSEQEKPAVIQMYNEFKGGVDCTDMVTKKFSCQRITRRWSKAVFENFVDLAIHNSFVLFHWANPTVSLTKRKYIEWLAKELAVGHVKARRKNDFGIHTDVKELMDTFIANYDALYGPTVCPTARCIVCSETSQLQTCVKLGKLGSL